MVRAGDGSTSRLAVEGGLAGGDVSPVAVVFGANASGKSTVGAAMKYVQRIVRQSALREAGTPLPVEPFLLDAESASRPFSAEVWFTWKGREYRYSFKIGAGVVLAEELKQVVVGQRRTVRTLFSREVVDGVDVITPSSFLLGAKRSIAAATRPNSLFLSKAAQENYKPLTEVYEWFVEPAPAFEELDDDWSDPRMLLLETDLEFRAWLINLLRQADLGVTGVSATRPAGKPPSHPVPMVASGADADASAAAAPRIHPRYKRPVLIHYSDPGRRVGGEIPWRLESAGTRQLWDLAYPVFQSLDSGRALVVDEMTALHPLVVRAILEMFQCEQTNPNNAQLIFTSHDMSLLGSFAGSGYMLDRDQIWFTEKDSSGATELIPLTDFHPRKDEDIQRAYLQGRFGAVPSVGTLSNMVRAAA
ncbi:MAG: ATP-binding protein [Bifidobacteriaceae bacterium]|nr:ATP-binding protein [Bifidobacteriaceae bacterium]